MTTPLNPLIIEPSGKASCAVIWMHGLGADAHDFEGIVPLLPTESQGIRMIFPNAPSRPVTINGGYVMPAWYDISDTALRNADKVGITESATAIQALIDAQIASGIPSERIVTAGFSQGGAMALHVGRHCPTKLAGILALSCYLLEWDEPAQDAETRHNRDTPILMIHGTEDAVVPYALGEQSAERLKAQGYDVSFVSETMGHEVSMPEITAIADWLYDVLDAD